MHRVSDRTPTLDPAEDLLHAGSDGRGEGPAWRESYYFGFYDERAGIGGFESFGYRPAKEHSGSMITLWRPGEVAAGLELGGALEAGARTYRVGGFEATCVEPFATWRLSYEGTLRRVTGAPLRQAVEELDELAAAQGVDVRFQSEFSAQGWVGAYESRASYAHIFDSCYEQVGSLSGLLELGDERFEIDCPAVRHHAWGERDWFADDEWNWCTVALEDGTAAGFWFRRDGETEEVNGWLLLDGTVEPVASVVREISVEDALHKPLPRRARYQLRDRAGRTLELSGEVLQITPAFFRGRGTDKLHWNDRSLVRFESSRGGGWGEVEFIELVADGAGV